MNKAAEKLPVIDFTKCRKCKKCIDACPNRAIIMTTNYCCAKCVKYCLTMKVPCHPKEIIFLNERCNKCGNCIDACSEKAISWFMPKDTDF